MFSGGWGVDDESIEIQKRIYVLIRYMCEKYIYISSYWTSSSSASDFIVHSRTSFVYSENKMKSLRFVRHM
jgi:hypothetical protein